MRDLAPDRKMYLLKQNRQMKSTSTSVQLVNKPSGIQPHYAASYGPTRAAQFLPSLVPQLTGDSGFMKRLSTAWGSSPSMSPTSAVDRDSATGSFSSSSSKITQALTDEQPALQPQTTGWTSWWTSSGGDRFPRTYDNGLRNEKSASWYVELIQHAKSTDLKTAKLLISLRVHLSTAKLTWIVEFLDAYHGAESLGSLLAGLVGKAGKRKKLNDVEETVLLEIGRAHV